MSLRFDGIHHRYGWRHPVLDGFSWVVPPGRTALLGPNGAGKSTLLAIAATALRPRRGRVALPAGSWPSTRAGAYRARVGWMPQENETVPTLTCVQNVTLAAWLKGMSVPDARRAALRALRITALEDLADKSAVRLSGGQRRRLCLAQALAHDPEIALLDEPTTGLDPAMREGFRRTLLALQGVDVLVSTHQVDDIDEVFDTVAVLVSGEIVFQGTPAEFLDLAPPGERRGEQAYLSLLPDVFA